MEFPKDIEFPDSISRGGPLAEMSYLMEDGNMEGKYLGQCLDSSRWGGMTTIMYEVNPFTMIDFIKNWMEQNKDDLKFHYDEPWPEFELPYVDYDVCPRNSKHSLRARGFDGTMRCIEEEDKELKKDFLLTGIDFDHLSKSRGRYYREQGMFDEEEYEEYINATDMVTVRERCGAILSDKEATLSLLDIIDRHNVFGGRRAICKPYCKDEWMIDLYGEKHNCFGHYPVKDYLIFPFDGWYLGRNVEYWYNQEPVGTAPFTTPLVSEQVKKFLITSATTDLEKTSIEEIEKEIQKGISI